MKYSKNTLIPFSDIMKAAQVLKGIARQTPLEHSLNLSEQYGCDVLLKREDLQMVRSYKIRGAYNKMVNLGKGQLENGVICSSAGNHAQGFAYACRKLQVKGKVYMPIPTTQQKIKQVKMFGKEYIEVVLVGDTYDDAYAEAIKDSEENNKAFIHPFDDYDTICGQGTVGLEIFKNTEEPIDFLFVPVGGGGLSAGVGSYFKQISPQTQIIGVEPKGAPAMKESLDKKEIVQLNKIDKFVDGAAVKKVGKLNFEICKEVLDDMVLVEEGMVCSTILKLYNEEAIVVEPAGALSIAALELYKDKIKGKNVCCIISGGNNDIIRMAEIKERSSLYEGLKHYFIIQFPQRAGALKEFLNNVLGPNDEICFFDYSKKNNRSDAPALIGIEFAHPDHYPPFLESLNKHNVRYEYINDNPDLFRFLI